MTARESLEAAQISLKLNVSTQRCAGVYSRHFTFNIKCIFKNLLNSTAQSSTNRYHSILSTQFWLMPMSENWCLATSTADTVDLWNWSIFWFELTTDGSRKFSNWPLWSSDKINQSVIRFIDFIIPDSLNVFWWFCSKWQLTQKGPIYSPDPIIIRTVLGLSRFLGHF